jgi:two-component system OmpR family sensor kinase
LSNFFKKIFFIGFFIFFILQTVFVSIISLKNYKEYKSQYDYSMRVDIELVSYKLNSKKYNINFIPIDKKLKLLKFYKTQKEVFMLFQIPLSQKYYLKISLPIEKYNKGLYKIKNRVFREFIFYLTGVFFLSIIFTSILLLPIKKAYELNEIFIKDILHDFNTPISSIKINLYLLKKQQNDNKYIQNIDLAIQNILNLEQNLKTYLLKQKTKNECFLVNDIIKEKIEFYAKLYPFIKVINHTKNLKLLTDKFAFERILDNILSNSFKYNKKQGIVHISQKCDYLVIKDTGKGIVRVSEVFKKFYKEQDRGLGIGLNIVYKLSKMIKMQLIIRSKPQKGTTIFLKLKNKQC